MRILHTSDWHLGRTFHGRVLDDAHAAFADHLVDLVEAEGVDAVVISGDVYDRAIPPTDSVRLLNDTLRRLTDRTQVVLTPGNHDSAQRLGFGSALFRPSLAVRAQVAEVDQPVIVPDPDGGAGLLVYALPYLDPDATRGVLPPLLSERTGEVLAPDSAAAGEPESPEQPAGPGRLARSHEAVVGGALRLVAQDLCRRRQAGSTRVPALVMAHAFVVGGQACEDSERDIRVGGVDSVASEVFETLGGSPRARRSGGLDYVALGHLHRPQEIRLPQHAPAGSTTGRRPRLVYSGSPLPFSFSEAPWPKSSALVEIDTTGVTKIDRVPTPVPHRIETVTGTMEELEGPEFDYAVGAWVRAVVRGPLPLGAPARLRTRFGEVLVVTREERDEEPRRSLSVTRAADPLEVARQFLQVEGEAEPSAKEQTVLAQAYEAVLAARRSA
ncbi:metallophosphoesterase family protein [Actinomyces faecalis]|uniref:metallophosphoesterase family protein n=1 Tax=Actinomyces faecalis TaxID=2722820 RepID=UPI0015582125|nr:exonuclease subunit SbcD [Actinomyces faecalis]